MEAVKRRFRISPVEAMVGGIIILTIFGIGFRAIESQIQFQKENATASRCHELAIAMFSYSNDNQGDYPFGSTSTKAFQELYDNHNLSDPTVVYLDIPAKVPASAKLPIALEAQNVCFDLVCHPTSGLKPGDNGNIPLFLATGLGRYEFKDGPNPVQLKNSPFMAFATINQEASFLRPSADGFVKLTPPDFKAPAKKLITIHP
jgi:hypothetical protein